MPALAKRPARARRAVGLASLAPLLIVAVVLLAPGLRKSLRPQLAAGADLAPARGIAADIGTLPAVPVLWEKLDLSAMPAEVAQDLSQGKYYYDKRLPGNFGLAIDYWKKAQARLGEAGPAELKKPRRFSRERTGPPVQR